MSDILSTSISGLRVSQNAISTTGHNIANANTDGYSRQTIDVNSNPANRSGSFFIGTGSYTADIQRVVDDFVTTQIRADTSLSSELDVFNEFIGQIDDLFSNQTTGLTPSLESFFSSLENVTEDPASISSRQLVLSEAESLADSFTTSYSRLDSLQENVNVNLRAGINTINNYAEQIANINQALLSNFNGGITGQPNDLLDQRDEALRGLSELVSIQVIEQDANVVNVALPNGIQLVRDTTVSTVDVRANEFDVTQLDIFLSNNTMTQSISDLFTGGEIGALLDFQNTVLEPSINEIGRIAIVLAEEINRLQQSGITLNNQFGENLFNDINIASNAELRVIPSGNNTTDDQILSVSISDTRALTTSDYEVAINASGTSYSITRLSDSREVISGTLPALPASISFDGLSLDISSGTFSSDDRFILQPTRYGARDIEVQSLLPEDIAFASPIATSTSLSNEGSGIISAGEVLQVVDSANQTLSIFTNEGELSPPLLIQFTTPSTYDILDNSDPGNPIQLDPPLRNQIYVPGVQNTLFAGDEGQTIVVSNGSDIGLPAANTTVNGYDAELLTFTTTDPQTGTSSVQTVNTVANASARTTAASLNNLTGVSANASNFLELRDFNVTFGAPLQLSLNGEDLVEYDGAAIAANVPNPTLNNGEDFSEYIAQQINNNDNLQALGIFANTKYDAANNVFTVQVHSTLGDDLTVGLEASAMDTIDVNDGNNADVSITATGLGTTDTLVVGGIIDITLDSNVVLTTTPGTSTLFGDSSAANFAQSSFMGIQANITGNPTAGDRFEIGFNQNAASDNRNALAMASLNQTNIFDNGAETFDSAYSNLIESVGIRANTARQNAEAAREVLAQSENLRESVSGVNLDEEAANLIRFEQLYSANARVITVAREMFDELINSF